MGDQGKLLKKKADYRGFKNTLAQIASSPDWYALEVQS